MEKTNSSERMTTSLLLRIQQVAMTVVTHRWISLGYLAGILLCLGGILLDLQETMFGMGLNLLAVVVFLSLTSFPKYWFVRPEAKLTPGYRAPHLLLIGIGLLSHCFLLPILVAPRFGFDPIGTAALVGCLTASIVWSEKPRFIGLFFLIFGTAFLPIAQNFWLSSDADYHPYRVIAFVAGWLGIGYWLLRQASLDESMKGYSLPTMNLFMGASGRNAKRIQNQTISKYLERNRTWAHLSDKSLDHLLSMKEVSRDRLTDKGFMVGVLPMGVPFAMVTTTLAIVFFQMITIAWPSFDKSALPFFINQLFLFSLMSPFMLFHVWWNKKPSMSAELLRENRREIYFKRLYFSSLKQTLFCMIIFAAGLMGMAIAYGGGTFGYIAASSYLSVIVSLYLFIASFAIWGAAFRSKFAGGLLQVVPLVVLMGVYLAALRSMFSTSRASDSTGSVATLNFSVINEPSTYLTIYLASGVVFLMGLIALRVSYKQWLRTELG